MRPKAAMHSGLHMPPSLDPTPTFGRIVAVGKGRQVVANDGRIVREEIAFEVGQVVKVVEAMPCFPEGRGGPEFYILNIDNIPCVVDGFEAQDEAELKLADAIERTNGHAAGAGIVVPKRGLALGK